MSLKAHLFDEDRGVSPVIGVILMVAITVILAAVIATFVMNMGPQQNSPANADLSFTNSTDTGGTPALVYWELSHGGGEELPTSEYRLEFEGYGSSMDLDSAYGSDSMTAADSFIIGNDTTGSGFSVTPDENIADTDFKSVTEVTLIWEDPESDQTQIVEEWEP